MLTRNVTRFLIVLRGGVIAAILASLLIPQVHAQTQAVARDDLEARSWTNANTVILYAHLERDEDEAAALFTLKFDEAGHCKIVKMHQMSKKEVAELEKE